MIYLDNAATTKVAPEVLEKMFPYLKEEFGNAGSNHAIGFRAAEAVNEARKQVADFIGADPCEIIFTSGGSEANNMALRCTRKYLESVESPIVLVGATEHDSILKTAATLPSLIVRVDDKGVIDVESIDRLLSTYSGIGMVSVMYVNNETGVVNPIGEIGRICKKHSAYFHTDCVQAAGYYPINVDDIGCDLMSISSHKIHGAKGVGALYVRNLEVCTPFIHGGAEQEYGYRGGTENVAGIVAFGEACRLAKESWTKNLAYCSSLRSIFYDTVQKALVGRGLKNVAVVNGFDPNETRGRILNLTFRGIDAETLVLLLSSRGVCVSAGSACTSHESKPSHVLTAMGISDDDARSAIRVSFSEENTVDEVEMAANIVASCVNQLRRKK